MLCTSPRTVGFHDDGKTICWSPKNYSKQYSTFQLACGKCIACRLDHARQISIRCVHEAQMHQNNSFVTLTYSDEKLTSQRLVYKDFQDFVKRLRNNIHQQTLDRMFPELPQDEQRKLWGSLPKERKKEISGQNKISIFVAGEYGDKTKRPHWHAIIFNWRPTDQIHKYTNHGGDKVFSSEILDRLWQNGIGEIGEVTLQSAGYCARYAAKKLVHGPDKSHDFNPIARFSSKHAIGKSWLEKYYADVFTHGYVVLQDGSQAKIPRYYEKWLKKNKPDLWHSYVTTTKTTLTEETIRKAELVSIAERKINMARIGLKGLQIKRDLVRDIILKQKLAKLTENTKI